MAKNKADRDAPLNVAQVMYSVDLRTWPIGSLVGGRGGCVVTCPVCGSGGALMSPVRKQSRKYECVAHVLFVCASQRRVAVPLTAAQAGGHVEASRLGG